MGASAIFSALLCCLQPETKYRETAETLEMTSAKGTQINTLNAFSYCGIIKTRVYFKIVHLENNNYVSLQGLQKVMGIHP